MFGTEKVICPKNSEGWMVGVWEGLNLGSIPNFFLCFGMHPKIIDVHPKLIPKGGVVQFCQSFSLKISLLRFISLAFILKDQYFTSPGNY